jgi:hypothetical protein
MERCLHEKNKKLKQNKIVYKFNKNNKYRDEWESSTRTSKENTKMNEINGWEFYFQMKYYQNK